MITPCLCVSPFAFLFVYRTINRITDFHPVADGTQITGTDYILRVLPLPAEASIASIVQNDVVLENTVNHIHYSIFKTDYWDDAEYTVIHDQQKRYPMTQR